MAAFVRRAVKLPVWMLDSYARRCDATRQRRSPSGRGVNLGTGGTDLPGWINIDETKPGDILARVPPIPLRSGSVQEVLMSHMIEHVQQDEAAELLGECRRILSPGGTITMFVPDTRWIVAAYLAHQMSNYHLNHWYLYSYCQESHHRWSYDWASLKELVLENGFSDVRRISRFRDPRLTAAGWFQFGMTARRT